MPLALHVRSLEPNIYLIFESLLDIGGVDVLRYNRPRALNALSQGIRLPGNREGLFELAMQRHGEIIRL